MQRFIVHIFHLIKIARFVTNTVCEKFTDEPVRISWEAQRWWQTNIV